MKFSIIFQNIINYSALAWSIYKDMKVIRYYEKIVQMIEKKRSTLSSMVLNVINYDACLMIEKDCCNGIFNELADKGITAIYKNKAQNIFFDEPYKSKNFKYYLLSPYLEINKEFESYHSDLKFLPELINNNLLLIFSNIKNLLNESPFSYFKYGEIEYKRAEGSNYIHTWYSDKDIYEFIQTQGLDSCKIYKDLKMVMLILKRIPIHSITKSQWSTKAVDLLFDLLIANNILKSKVDMSEYPEIVQILFPHRFLNVSNFKWHGINILNLSLDLRNINKSNLKEFFNLEEVNRIIQKYGGFFSVSETYSY